LQPWKSGEEKGTRPVWKLKNSPSAQPWFAPSEIGKPFPPPHAAGLAQFEV
jgi:hypothetical protein